ncbi:hypothetical protein Droror1_Dr00015954 [Drosera rotundifolia]
MDSNHQTLYDLYDGSPSSTKLPDFVGVEVVGVWDDEGLRRSFVVEIGLCFFEDGLQVVGAWIGFGDGSHGGRGRGAAVLGFLGGLVEV